MADPRAGRSRRRSGLGGLLACLAALLLGACGSSSPPPRTRASTTTTTAVAPPATTSTASTTTQVLPGTGRPQIAIGDKNTPEQFVLGELYDVALAGEGYSVTLSRNIGPLPVYTQAVKQGSLNLYPEYLNTWDSSVAGYTHGFRNLKAALAAGQSYAATQGMELLKPSRFGDTDGIAVTSSYAAAHHLRTMFDLRRVATALTIGAPLEFSQSPTGLPALEQAYGFQPAATTQVDIGSQYDELQEGIVQAAWVQTTDPELATSEFVLLGDPRHVLGYGNVVPVTTSAVVAAEGPTFTATIDRISALLSMSVMRELNTDVETDHEAPVTVATQFLQAHGLLTGSGTA
jgi:osmoprotectant transport system substrate-binding protein